MSNLTHVINYQRELPIAFKNGEPQVVLLGRFIIRYHEGDKNDNISALATDVMSSFVLIAEMVFMGKTGEEVEGLKVEPFYQLHNMTAMENPSVSLWAEVFDNEGKAFTLTMTSNSSEKEVWESMAYAIAMSDAITEFGDGYFPNLYGKTDARTSTLVAGKVANKKTPSAKTSKSGGGFKSEAPKKSPKAKKVIQTFKEVEELDANATFTMKVSEIEHNKASSSFNFYGYKAGVMGELLPDRDKGVWCKFDGFSASQGAKLKEQIEEILKCQLDTKVTPVPPDIEFTVSAQKMVSQKSGIPYYKNIKVEGESYTD